MYCTLCYSNTFNWILYCIYGYKFVTVMIGYCYIIQTSTSGPYSASSNVRHLQKRTLREQRDWTRFTTMTSVLYSTNWPMTSSSVLYKLTYQKVLCNIACISLPLMNIISEGLNSTGILLCQPNTFWFCPQSKVNNEVYTGCIYS